MNMMCTILRYGSLTDGVVLQYGSRPASGIDAIPMGIPVAPPSSNIYMNASKSSHLHILGISTLR